MFTSQDDKFIKENYGVIPTNEIAEKLNKEPSQIRDRMKGLRRKERNGLTPIDWTPEEDVFLESLAGTLPPRTLYSRFRRHGRRMGWRCRSNKAIDARIIHLQLSRRPDVHHYTPVQLEAATNIDKATIKRWIKNGLLKAERNDPSNENSTWLIHVVDFLNLLVENPSIIKTTKNFDKDSFQWVLLQMADYGVKPVIRKSNNVSKQV